LFFSCWNLGGPSFQAEDETHHVTVIQQMLHHGHILLPMDEAGPYFNKPPLKMWASLPFLRILGEFPLTYRLIDGFCGFLTFGLVFYLSLSWFHSYSVGLIAILTLGGAKLFLFDHGVRSAVQDSPIILGTTLCLWLGWLLIEDRRQGLRPFWTISGVTALSLLIKSAGALLGPMLVSVTWILRRLPRRVPLRHIALAGLIVVLPYALYLGWVQCHYPEAFAISLGREVLSRTADGFQRQHDPYFYITLLAAKKQGIDAPWLIIIFCVALIDRWRQKRVELEYLLVWSIGPLLLFSCAKTRLEWYIAPALPAQAILSGYVMARCIALLREACTANQLRIGQAFRVVLLLAVSATGGYGIGSHLWETVPRIIRPSDVLPIDTASRKLLASLGPTPIGITQPIEELLPGAFERAHLRTVSQDRYITPEADRASFSLAPIALMKSVDAAPMLVDPTVTGYLSIEPTIQFPQQHQRHHWLTLLARTTPHPPSFLPTHMSTTLNAAEELFPLPTGYFPSSLGISVSADLPPHLLSTEEQPSISIRIHRTSGSTGLVVPCTAVRSASKSNVICELPSTLIRQATPTLARLEVTSPSTDQYLPITVTTSLGTSGAVP
jgi:hypothetical protein